ncbi:hypothetical protein LINGRAHAP2_LOCUS15432 [Linum grandiflorum]
MTFDDKLKFFRETPYMRVIVMLDVTTPLQIDQKVRQPGGDWLRGKFRYEKLPTFYFPCGRIGHIERHCALYNRAPNPELLVRKWDASLWAEPQKQVVNGGAQWLVPAADNSNIGGSGFGRPPLRSDDDTMIERTKEAMEGIEIQEETKRRRIDSSRDLVLQGQAAADGGERE